MKNIIENLNKLNIDLPEIAKPIADYVPYVKTKNIIFISGQIPIKNKNILYKGKLGKEISVEEGKKAAELCIINTFAILKKATNNNLLSIKKCVKLNVFINSIDNFFEQPEVADGASKLLNKILHPNGSHSRSAVSCNSLPRNVSVEIDSIFEIKSV